VGLGLPSADLPFSYNDGIVSLADSLGAVVTWRWPRTGSWAISPSGAAKAAHVTADGERAILCGCDGYPYEPTAVIAPTSATAGEPTQRVAPFGEAASESSNLFYFVGCFEG